MYEDVTSLLACSEEVCRAVMLWNCFLLRDELRPLTAVCAADRPTVYFLVTLFILLHVLCSPFAFSFNSFCSFSVFLSLILVFLNPSSFVLLFHGFMLFSFVRSSFLFLSLLFCLSPVRPLHHFVLPSWHFWSLLLVFFALSFDSHLLCSFLLHFPLFFLVFLPPVPSVSTNPYHILFLFRILGALLLIL